MNKSTLRNLAIVLFALVAILVGLEFGDSGGGSAVSGGPLFPDLRARVNDIDSIVAQPPGDAAPVRLSGASGTWVVDSKDGFPADIGKIREVLLALADARILEQKTANPELYGALGVRDPDVDGSQGVRFTLSGGDARFGVIIGNVNQGSNRYVRIDGDAQSVLIDQNPDLPADASGWLQKDLIDIDAAEIASVEIRHADDELIRVAKSSPDDTDFAVEDVPEGRELSYGTVGNGMGSALADLRLDDVRAAVDGEPRSVTTFRAFDGRRIAVSTFGDGDEAWLGFAAELDAPAAAEEAPDVADAAADEETGEDPAADVAALDARLSGWQFRVPDFKKNQLTRRWEDILKEEAE